MKKKNSRTVQTIEQFVDDVFELFRAEDKKIFDAMANNENAEFNAYRWRGLGLFSTTEPVLKYLIYTKLIHKYMMWSEVSLGYEKLPTPKYLDLALTLDMDYDENDEEIEPDTAIEMKWAGVNKNGEFNTVSQTRLINDLNKLAKNSIKNKYFMQFMIVKKGILDGKKLVDLNTYVDNRRVKVVGEPIHRFFDTDSGKEQAGYQFHIVVWRVAKRGSKGEQ